MKRNGEAGTRNAEWMKVRLGDVVEIDRTGVDPANLEYQDSYVGLEHLDASGGIDWSETIGSAGIKSTKFRFGPDHILFGKLRPYLRKVARPYTNRVCSTDILPLLPKDGFDKGFLFHLLRTDDFIHRATQACAGANLPRLSPEKFRAFEFRVPRSLPEQKRIAAILDKADAIRRKLQQSLRLSDEFLRSVFLDMFGDPVTNPKGWPKVELGEVIKVKSGNGLIAKDMAENGIFPVYGGSGINGHHDQFMYEERKIVMGRVGAYCGAVHYTLPRSWITDNALYVEYMKRPMDPVYLVDALRFANLNQYAGQAGQPLISASRIYPVEINDPPPDQQASYAAIVNKTQGKIQKSTALLQEAETLFSSLQQRAFRGEL